GGWFRPVVAGAKPALPVRPAIGTRNGLHIHRLLQLLRVHRTGRQHRGSGGRSRYGDTLRSLSRLRTNDYRGGSCHDRAEFVLADRRGPDIDQRVRATPGRYDRADARNHESLGPMLARLTADLVTLVAT